MSAWSFSDWRRERRAMEKLRNVKLGDKFVSRYRPGVWRKVTHNTAKCIFGAPDDVGSESETDPEAPVFVIDEERAAPKQAPAPVPAEGMDVKFIDDDEKELFVVKNANAAQVAAYSHAEIMQMKQGRKTIVFTTESVGVDYDANVLLVEVRIMKTGEDGDDGD